MDLGLLVLPRTVPLEYPSSTPSSTPRVPPSTRVRQRSDPMDLFKMFFGSHNPHVDGVPFLQVLNAGGGGAVVIEVRAEHGARTPWSSHRPLEYPYHTPVEYP